MAEKQKCAIVYPTSDTHMKTKIPGELWLMVAMIVFPLTFVQLLHVIQHSDYCKTESEWETIKEYGEGA